MPLEGALSALIGTDLSKHEAANGLPDGILARLIDTESRFNPRAVSPKGAQGLIQLMPATAKAYHVTDPFDPEQNVAAGARYLGDLKKQYGGDIRAAVAHYNGGGAAGQAVAAGAQPPAAETQAYVPKVAGNDEGPLAGAISALSEQAPQPITRTAPAPAPQALAASESGTQPAAPGKTIGAAFGPARQATLQSDPTIGAIEALTQMGTAALGQAVGGARMAMGLLPGRDLKADTEAGQRVQESMTYQPRTEAGRTIAALPEQAVGLIEKGYNWLGSKVELPDAGTALTHPGQTLGDVGANIGESISPGGRLGPVLGAIGATLPAAVGVGMGIRAAKGKVAAGSDVGSGVSRAAGSEPGSVGAAATTTRALVDQTKAAASPEFKAALEKTAAKDVNVTALERQAAADSLPVPVRLTRGQAIAGQDAGRALSIEQNMRGANPELAARFSEQNTALKANIDAIRETAAPDVYGIDHVQNGQALVDAYKTKDLALRNQITNNYKAMEAANNGVFPIDTQAFVSAAEAGLKKQLKTHYLDPAIRQTLEDLKAGGAMDFESFESLRTNLANDMRGPDGNKVAAAHIVRKALEELPLPPEAAHLKGLADVARNSAKARFDLIRRDPAYKAATNDAAAVGEASPLADKFIHSYVVAAPAANVGTMIENLGRGSEAHQTMAAGVINHLKRSAGVTPEGAGNFSHSGYVKVLNNLAPGGKLQAVVGPEAARQLDTLGAVARDTQFQPRGSFVNNSNTFVAQAAEHAKSLAEGAVNKVTLGVGGTAIRNAAQRASARKFTAQSLKPGAGISLKDVRP